MNLLEIFINNNSLILSNPANFQISPIFLGVCSNEDANKVHIFQAVDMSLRAHNLQVPSPSLFFLTVYLLKKLGGLCIELLQVMNCRFAFVPICNVFFCLLNLESQIQELFKMLIISVFVMLAALDAHGLEFLVHKEL